MRWLGAVLFAVLLAGWVLTGSALAQVSSIETDIVHIFGETIHFSAKVKSSIPVKAGVLFFRAVGDTRTTIGLADVENLGPNRYLLTYLHKIADYPLRPFSTIQYHWELTLANGEVVSSPEQTYLYADNRFNWKTLGDGQFRVHWYKGELPFAQRVLDIAHEGKERINSLLTIPLPDAVPVEIYIYEDNESLQSALQTKAEEWVAGHADPDLGVVLMALPESPERQLLAEQRIPHELMHIFLYNSTPLGYKNIPVWLTEGLASLAELYSNPDYPFVLEEAGKEEGLLPMSALCDGFPRESSGALLAYAQSQDFTQHLLELIRPFRDHGADPGLF